MAKNVRILNLVGDSELQLSQGDYNIVVGDHLPTLKVLSLCLQNHARHVVQQSNFSTPFEMDLSSKLASEPKKFFETPLSLILGAPNPTPESETAIAEVSVFLSKPNDKNLALSQTVEFIKKHGASKTLIHDIRMVTDELITNSLSNAPYVDFENNNPGQPRDPSLISVDPARKPHVFAGADDSRLVVGCTDYYGKLNIRKLIERVQKCYSLGPAEMMNFGPGGAGIGTFMMFESCASFYLAVMPGKMTTVTCVFPLNLSGKKRYEMPKNLHIIYQENNDIEV